MTLTELANKYGTDKGTATEPRHGYTEIYERYLSLVWQQVTRVLEIGIQYGASLRMWRDYFPKAEIIGIDNSEAWVMEMMRAEDNQRIGAVLGDVTDDGFWREFEQTHKEGFDLVVDDGSHFSRHIIMAFDRGWRLLRPGGLYIIEDLHQGFELENRAPVFEWLKLIGNLQLHECGAGQTGRVVTGADMEWMHFYKSVVVMKKRI